MHVVFFRMIIVNTITFDNLVLYTVIYQDQITVPVPLPSPDLFPTKSHRTPSYESYEYQLQNTSENIPSGKLT